jgi:hypothetical protein
MTAEAEQKLAVLEPADAAAVRADELKNGLAPAVRTTRKPLTTHVSLKRGGQVQRPMQTGPSQVTE